MMFRKGFPLDARMKKLNPLWLALGLWCPLAPSSAQAPFPPAALSTVQSPEAAVQALGAARPEFSTHVLLDTPEISLAGEIAMSVHSEIPGTSQIYLFRQFPRVLGTAPARPGSAGPATPTARPRPGAAVPPNSPPPSPTVLLAAVQLKPGEAPTLKARVAVDRNERFTTLVFAQGRWFFTARELKLARPLPAAATP